MPCQFSLLVDFCDAIVLYCKYCTEVIIMFGFLFFSSAGGKYIGNALDDRGWSIYQGKSEFYKFWHSWWPWSLILFIVAGIVLILGICFLVNYIRTYRSTSFTVTFHETDKQVLLRGSYLTPPMPKREGYVFAGWFKDTACTEPWKSTDKVKRDITLYPKWVKES